MKPLPLTPLLIWLGASLAQAQLLVPIGQDRMVHGLAEADDSITFMSDSNSDQATSFGLFDASAAGLVTPAGTSASANGGGWQHSQVLASSFVAEGSSFASAFGDSPWSTLGDGESLASLEFELTFGALYHVFGSLEGYDGGYALWELYDGNGAYLDGRFGIEKGPIPIDASGDLGPGSYRIVFRCYSNAGTSGSGSSFGSSNYELEMELTTLGGSYCTAAANSFGSGATLSVAGSHSIAENDFHVRANGAVPAQMALLYYGLDQIQLPFGDGFRCVGGASWRLTPPSAIDASGAFARQVDFGSGPAASGAGQILPLSSWNFQLWYRDPTGPGGSGFNLSDALWITFAD